MNEQKQLFHSIVDFINAVHQKTSDLTKDNRLATVTPLQYNILEYIALNQPVTLSQISDCQHISMPNTSRETKKLVEKQLCEKNDNAQDRRKQSIQLTQAGQSMMDEAFGRIEEKFLAEVSHLSEQELKEVIQAVHILRTKVFT